MSTTQHPLRDAVQQYVHPNQKPDIILWVDLFPLQLDLFPLQLGSGHQLRVCCAQPNAWGFCV